MPRPPPRSLHLAPGLVALVFAVVSGCQCSQGGRECEAVEQSEPGRPGPCGEGFSACGDGYRCTPTGVGASCCVLARACTDEGGCCPGQACHDGERVCVDRYVPCAADRDCDEAAGQRCLPWAADGTRRCQLTACENGNGCPTGQSCFAGECIAELPCGGACGEGEACLASTGQCQRAACPTSCAPGFIAAFTDGTNRWNSCSADQARCACVELPPLRSEDTGRFASVARGPGGELLVAAYDGEYGDLVVHGAGAIEYVDGVPTEGAIRYAPSGPRGGVTEAGPDVGRYTDAASAGGRVYVSYLDATHRDLKLAVRSTAGRWTVIRVDGADADTGYYTSLAVDAAGRPGIVYFQRGAGASFNLASCPGTPPVAPRERLTALRFARATSPDPVNASDFAIVTLACQARPAAPCDGCAGICADTGSGPSCYPSASGCTGCDALAQACVLDGTAKCGTRASPVELLELPDGVGLFPSLAFRGNDAVIAYTARTAGKGSLYGAGVSSTGAITPPVLLDGAADTLWTDLAIDPSSGAIAIAYADLAGRSLKYWTSPTFASGVPPTVVDSGQHAPGDLRSVGADASLFFSSSGQAIIAYQDATHADLKRARRAANGAWEVVTLAGQSEATGFFPQVVDDQGRLVTTRLQTVQRDGEPRLRSSLSWVP